MRSSIELSRHAASTLRILRLGSNEEQSNYISMWSQIVSICAQELKHGSSIWMQSIENNVQNQILSDPQGTFTKYLFLMTALVIIVISQILSLICFLVETQASSISLHLEKFTE